MKDCCFLSRWEYVYGKWKPSWSIWDLPIPGIKLVSPVFVSGLFTTEPPGKYPCASSHPHCPHPSFHTVSFAFLFLSFKSSFFVLWIWDIFRYIYIWMCFPKNFRKHELKSLFSSRYLRLSPSFQNRVNIFSVRTQSFWANFCTRHEI